MSDDARGAQCSATLGFFFAPLFLWFKLLSACPPPLPFFRHLPGIFLPARCAILTNADCVIIGFVLSFFQTVAQLGKEKLDQLQISEDAVSYPSKLPFASGTYSEVCHHVCVRPSVCLLCPLPVRDAAMMLQRQEVLLRFTKLIACVSASIGSQVLTRASVPDFDGCLLVM